MIQSEEQRRQKKLKKNEQGIRELWGSKTLSSMHVIRILNGEEWNIRQRNILKNNV